MDEATYSSKLAGALLGRLAGCTLGAPVEFWPVAQMEALARANGEPFPPVDYWQQVPDPAALRYETSPREAYTRRKMNGVPVDDDIVYTLLGLLIAEEFGPDFTPADVGSAWLKYLPFACTAEDAALRKLRAGVPAAQAADPGNPQTEWIGAAIRADPWGYLAPGQPARAAELARRDAGLSHRGLGIHGEMFWAAAIAAAFAVRDPLEALRSGLAEIPAGCDLARHIRWALAEAPRMADYEDARAAVEARFPGMEHAHTANNACLTVFGLALGGTDFTRVIGETVAMGLDNDCTAATAGSLVGAIIGRAGIPAQWMAAFHDTIHTYLIGHPRFSIADVVRRFAAQTARFRA